MCAAAGGGRELRPRKKDNRARFPLIMREEPARRPADPSAAWKCRVFAHVSRGSLIWVNGFRLWIRSAIGHRTRMPRGGIA